MVTSRSVPQQIEQMLSARAGHNRLALRLLQMGHVKVFSCNSSETKIMPHFRSALAMCEVSGARGWGRKESGHPIIGPSAHRANE
jgi:hypothetical protein